MPREKATTGTDAGTGGNGGQVRILYNDSWGSVATATSNLLQALQGESRQSDSRTIAEGFVGLISQTRISSIYQVPPSLETVEGVMQAERNSFQEAVVKLLLSLPVSRAGEELSRTINVSGGIGGRGSPGSVTNGKSGRIGTPGTFIVMPIWKTDKILEQEVCYAHPVQCRMLLEKAKFLYSCGSPESKTRSTRILERLQQRLAPFEKPRSPFPKLWEAYRKAESRLFINSGPENEEPVSILQLRAVADEATVTLQRVLSEIDFYGYRPDEVPRCSYVWYSSQLESSLAHLTEIQSTYVKLLSRSLDVSKDLGTLTKRAKVCNDSCRYQKSLLEEAKRALIKTGNQVQVCDESVTAGKKSLLRQVDKVEERIQAVFNISLTELVDAVGQLVFVQIGLAKAFPYVAPYAAVQASPILNVNELRKQFRRQLDYLQRDDGVDVNRKYLLRQLREVSNGLRGLSEGYKAAVDDGSLSLNDPGGDKLFIKQTELESLIKDFSDALSEETLENVRKEFNSFVCKCRQRACHWDMGNSL